MGGKVAVVSHDAGGAEILSSWLRRNKTPFCISLDGPAKKIFSRKFDECNSIALTEAINQSDWVLCGTSWQSNFERQAIVQAQIAGKKVVAFLDHWSNYEKRFKDSNTIILPDEIWVGDKEAKKLAEKIFPKIPVIQHSNPYFLDIKDELGSVKLRRKKKTETCSILYVCEPTGERSLKKYGDARFLSGYSEKDALMYFIDNIQILGCSHPVITLRPHPSEDKGKYNWVVKDSCVEIIAGGDVELIQEVAEADVVVGCASMALVVALLAQKRVLSCIPPGGKTFCLPYDGIERLQDLLEKSQGILHD